MSMDDVVGRCNVVPQGAVPTCEQPLLPLPAAAVAAAAAAHALLRLVVPLVKLTNACGPSPLIAARLAPSPPAAAAIDTFECAGTFTRKTKKFSAAPKLPVPAELQQQQAAAAPAPAARADKGALFVWASFECVWEVKSLSVEGAWRTPGTLLALPPRSINLP